MTLNGKRISVAFPDTVLEEHDSLREKTVKLGQVARACSIFGVDSVEVFRDPRGGGEAPLIRRVLEYLETPQYLRRRLFPLDESLKYAGLLPPLRIPSHKPKVASASLHPGEFREGAVLDDGVTVDVGLEVPLSAESEGRGWEEDHSEDNLGHTPAGRPGEPVTHWGVLGVLRRREGLGGTPVRSPVRAQDSHLAPR